VMNADYPEVLEGYFPIYERGARSLGKITSKVVVTAPRRPRKSPAELAEAAGKKRTAAAAAQAAAAGAAEAGAAAGGRGGGMRGGGMRGGGMRGGGMRGGRGRGRMRGMD